MKKSVFSKALAFVLCLAMILPVLTMLPLPTLAASGSTDSEYTSATSTETVYIDGIHYYIQKSVSYSGNSTYSLNVRIYTSLSESETPLFRTSAENGYFTVATSGYYLLELWGGTGADGKGTEEMPAGNGGTAGYVYAKVWLEKGQTLAYSIGTNGAMTNSDGDGGGENGTGGGHGDTGRAGVGGGGGYSALYFFNEGEFKESWLTEDKIWNMPESARVQNYVMIAAGGGGGGGVAMNAESYATDAAGNKKTADGGAGGSISSGISMTLSGSNYPVEGYIFSGKNGKSNGTSNAYVGKGGTNVPGAGASTMAGLYDPTLEANDWTGTYTMNNAPGAGGTGNLRGGGGGAGYCGGGGGNMQGLLLPMSVGGGGGGSSFLARAFGENSVAIGNSVSAEIRALLKGSAGISEISDQGGAFTYTYLGDGSTDPVVDTTYLKSVTVEGQFSQYFEAISYMTSDGTVGDMGALTENGAIAYDAETGVFTVTGANINPATMTSDGTVLSVIFTVVPKAGFAGGNNVPLLSSVKATVTRGADDVLEITASEQADTDYVNVPLQFKIRTNSAVHSLSENQTSITMKGSDLYEADYADVITAFKSSSDTNYPTWEYDFISAMADYKIYKGKNATSGTRVYNTTTLTITQTTHYTVSMVVTVKTGTYAKIGPAITTASNTIKSVATITLIAGNVFDAGWSYTLTAQKTLSYKDGTFVFGQETTQTLERQYQTGSFYTYSGSEVTYSQAFTVAASGYYLLQAWGARGGDGGDAHASAQRKNTAGELGSLITRDATGGSGAAGASYYGYVYLQAGDVVTVTAGKRGTDGTDESKGINEEDGVYNRSYYANGTGGQGGGYAAVSLTRDGTTQYLLIAGGGGGGGGAGACCSCGTLSALESRNIYNGKSASALGSTVTTEFGDINSYFGGTGSSGNAYISSGQASFDWSGSSASAGTIAGTYVNPEFLNVGNNETETLHMNRLAEAMITQGGVQTTSGTTDAAAQITYICAPETTELLNAFPGVESTGKFTRYFDVVEDENGYVVDMVISSRSYDTKTVEKNGETTSVTYRSGEELVASFSYQVTENEDGTTSYEILSTVYHPEFVIVKGAETPTYRATCEFTFSFALVPTEGFMGGNDVPLLAESVCLSKGANQGALAENPISDYANVEINYDLDSIFDVKDGYVVLGDADTANDSISSEALYTLGALYDPDSEDAWKYEFIELVAPTVTSYAPTKTTTYSITAQVAPKAAAEKAIISGNNTGISLTKTVTVAVKYPVTYELSHMQTTGEALVTASTELRISLTPEAGYTAPPAYDSETGVRYISLSIGGVTKNTTFTYDEETGEFVIPASAVTGAIVITASAKKQLYSITYIYYLEGDTDATPREHKEWYLADDEISYQWMQEELSVPSVEGHTFIWEWDTDDGLQPTRMPAYHVMAVGRYLPNKYQLTVHYKDSADNELAPSYTAQVAFGAEYNVLSPTVAGYMASSAVGADDPFAVKGTMGAGDVTVTVTYLFAENRLVILYLDKNGNEIATRYDETLSENAAYTVDSPLVDGYTVRSGFETVSGTMVGTESLTVRVYYDPNRYTVNFEYRYEGSGYPGPRPDGSTLAFDFSGATMDETAFAVEYLNLYVYNALTGEYGLPEPLALGYVFEGWYTDTTYQTAVTEETVVTLPPHTTLYAKWAPAKYTVTIRYDFVRDEDDAVPDYSLLPEGTLYHDTGKYYYYRLELYAGEAYCVAITDFTGFTTYLAYGTADEQASPTEIAGTMPAMPVVYDVTYVINVYTVRFVDAPGENITYPEGFGDEQPTFNTAWLEADVTHGKAPVYDATKPHYAYDATTNNSATYQHYSFCFTGWKNGDTGVCYAWNETLPAVSADVTYYACYEARENIAVLEDYQGNVLLYFASLQDAVDAALATSDSQNMSRRPVVKLYRPVSGTAVAIDLTQTEETPTVILQNSSVRYITIDLNGYTLSSNTTVFDNTVSLLLIDSAGGGAINVAADGEVAGIVTSGYQLTIGTTSTDAPCGVTLNVSSTGGSVKGIAGRTGVSIGTVYLYAGSITANAAGYGYAYGLYCLNTSGSCMVYGSLHANAVNGNAYGVYVYNSLSLLNGASVTATATGSGIAYGGYFSSTVPSLNGADVAISATSNTGAAYGCYYMGSSNFSLYGTGLTVCGTSEAGTAYGVYTSRLVLSGEGIRVQGASTSGNAYGVYTTYIGCNNYADMQVTATSQEKNATALHITTGFISSRSTNIYPSMSATAPNGTAIGIAEPFNIAYTLGGTSYACAISATGKTAYAVNSSQNTVSVTVYADISATSTTELARGIHMGGGTILMQDGASITVATDSGQAHAVSNASLNLSSTAATVSMSATSVSGRAILLYNTTTLTVFSETATLTATTESGIACGVYVTGETAYTFSEPFVLGATATAASGCAYGVYVFGGDITVAGSVTAEGPTACGLYMESGTATLQATAVLTASTDTGSAYGAWVKSGVLNGENAFGVTATAAGADGAAYGIYNSGTVTSLGAKITVSATGNAYGIANVNGTVQQTASTLTVSATSEGASAFGIYNNGGSVGAAGYDGSVSNGVITASIGAAGSNAWALYAEAGYIYIRGSNLYYKGATNETAVYDNGNVVVCAGYLAQLLAEDHATYPLYYRLIAIEYTLTYVQTDFDGNNRTETVMGYTIEFTEADKSWLEPAFLYSYEGYTTKWQDYDFSVPENGTGKEVYCIFDPNSYTITFVSNGGSETAVMEEKYTYAISAPAEPTKYGYRFAGWYSDAELTQAFVFDTMPLGGITLCAKWELGTFTVTFVTNGGSEIAPVTGTYGSSVTVSEPVRPSYTFNGWYYDAELSNYYSYQLTTIPGEDLTLYAAWEVSPSVVLLGACKSYTVVLNTQIDYDGNGSPDVQYLYFNQGELSVYMMMDDSLAQYWMPSLIPAEASPTGVACAHVGWQTADGAPVDLTSGIGSWDVTFTNGTIELYPIFVQLPDLADGFDILVQGELSSSEKDYYAQQFGAPQDYLGAVQITQEKYGAGGSAYLTFKAIAGGTYTFSLLNMAGSTVEGTDYSKHVTFSIYSEDGTVREKVVDTDMEAVSTLTQVIQYPLELETGDVVVIQAYHNVQEGVPFGETIFGTFVAMPDFTSDTMAYMSLIGGLIIHNAMDFFFYTVDMGVNGDGVVTLPCDPEAGYENIIGWTWREDGVLTTEDPITQMTPAMLENTAAWTSFDGTPMLQLLPMTPNGVLTTWFGYIGDGRHFNPEKAFDFDSISDESELLQSTTYRNGAVTFAFFSEDFLGMTGVGALHFENGLPVGATITLMDLVSNYPIFYYYIVSDAEDGIQTVPLSSFTRMGGGAASGGCTAVMMFSISYAGTKHALESETVTLAVNGADTDVTLAYNFLTTNEVEFAEKKELLYTEDLEDKLGLPVLTPNTGYGKDDTAILIVHLEDQNGNTVPLPVGMQITANAGELIEIPSHGEFAFVRLGTVAYQNTAVSVPGTVTLDAFRNLGFDGYLVYEIAIVPEWTDLTGASCFGTDTIVHTRYRLPLAVLDAPSVAFQTEEGKAVRTMKGTVVKGVDLILNTLVGSEPAGTKELSLYVYQLQENGCMDYTDNCATLLDGFTVDNTGAATANDGTSLKNGELTLPISANATSGVYFLMLYYGGQYAVYTLTVT